jgi:hypothetical protein
MKELADFPNCGTASRYMYVCMDLADVLNCGKASR